MRNLLGLLFILFVATSFTSIKKGKEKFHVTIEQNGKTIMPINGEVSIDKSEFDMILNFSKPMGVLVNASFKEKTYQLAVKGAPLDKLPGFNQTGMAEGLLNKDRDVLIAEEASGYWFYDDDKMNRFNHVEKYKRKYICTRTIQYFYDVETKKDISVKDADAPLYLVFVSYRRNPESHETKELKREWIKINWKN